MNSAQKATQQFNRVKKYQAYISLPQIRDEDTWTMQINFIKKNIPVGRCMSIHYMFSIMPT